MAKNRQVYVIGGKRTPFCEWISGKKGNGERGGVLRHFTAIELGAFAAIKTLQSARINPEWIDQLVFGNAVQVSEDSLYGGRHVALKAGLTKETSSLTINRICGSGIEVFRQAAFSILQEDANFVLAGGAENLSQTPFVIRNLRQYLGTKIYLELKKKVGGGMLPAFEDVFKMTPGLAGIRFPLEDLFWTFLRDDFTGLSMAETAEKLGKKYGVTREEADAFALRSHLLIKQATERGVLAEEIAAIGVDLDHGILETVSTDDHFVPNCSLDGLAKLNPAFIKDGLVTAGNASGVVDGAGFCLLASGRAVKKHCLRPLGRILSWSAVGVDPVIMGIGPVPAVTKALSRAGLKKRQIDLWEINEAFSCQYLAVEKELGLDREKVNVNGGAIGLGHPFAATGVRMVMTLLLELRRRKKRYGVAAACIGGGQGMAIVVEAI